MKVMIKAQRSALRSCAKKKKNPISIVQIWQSQESNATWCWPSQLQYPEYHWHVWDVSVSSDGNMSQWNLAWNLCVCLHRYRFNWSITVPRFKALSRHFRAFEVPIYSHHSMEATYCLFTDVSPASWPSKEDQISFHSLPLSLSGCGRRSKVSRS